MKASKKSLHAKLYSFTYTSDLPVNLCPYFWKLVFALIVFIPNAVIQIPALLIPNERAEDCFERRKVGFYIYAGGSFLLVCAFVFLALQYNMVKMMFCAYSYDWIAGIIALIMDSIIIASIFLPKMYRAIKLKRSGVFKEKHPGIVREFVKAKYNKYCPKIDWE